MHRSHHLIQRIANYLAYSADQKQWFREVVLLVNNFGTQRELVLNGVASKTVQQPEGKAKGHKVLAKNVMVRLFRNALRRCYILTWLFEGKLTLMLLLSSVGESVASSTQDISSLLDDKAVTLKVIPRSSTVSLDLKTYRSQLRQ